MGDFLKNINWKHVLIMCIGNVFAGMGIGIFKLAGLGTDKKYIDIFTNRHRGYQYRKKW